MPKNLQCCPHALPPELSQHATALAYAWIISPLRPIVSQRTVELWVDLIQTWIASEDMPLFVRRNRGQRGSVLSHSTGRHLIPCDNSTAHWAYGLALRDVCPSLSQVRNWLRNDRIPVAMALKKEERKSAKHTCGRQLVNLNELGWKLCHVDRVGIGFKKIEEIRLDDLEQHFQKYISPGNMFLVPKIWSGLGEMPEMIAAARSAFLPASA
jgi:hypothetical protein